MFKTFPNAYVFSRQALTQCFGRGLELLQPLFAAPDTTAAFSLDPTLLAICGRFVVVQGAEANAAAEDRMVFTMSLDEHVALNAKRCVTSV